MKDVIREVVIVIILCAISFALGRLTAPTQKEASIPVIREKLRVDTLRLQFTQRIYYTVSKPETIYITSHTVDSVFLAKPRGMLSVEKKGNNLLVSGFLQDTAYQTKFKLRNPERFLLLQGQQYPFVRQPVFSFSPFVGLSTRPSVFAGVLINAKIGVFVDFGWERKIFFGGIYKF